MPDINNKACVNLHNFKSLEEGIERIIELDNNMDLYVKTLKEKAFLRDDIGEFYKKGLEDYLVYIFSQGKDRARRRFYAFKINDHVNSLMPKELRRKRRRERSKQKLIKKYGWLIGRRPIEWVFDIIQRRF